MTAGLVYAASVTALATWSLDAAVTSSALTLRRDGVTSRRGGRPFGVEAAASSPRAGADEEDDTTSRSLSGAPSDTDTASSALGHPFVNTLHPAAARVIPASNTIFFIRIAVRAAAATVRLLSAVAAACSAVSTPSSALGPAAHGRASSRPTSSSRSSTASSAASSVPSSARGSVSSLAVGSSVRVGSSSASSSAVGFGWSLPPRWDDWVGWEAYIPHCMHIYTCGGDGGDGAAPRTVDGGAVGISGGTTGPSRTLGVVPRGVAVGGLVVRGPWSAAAALMQCAAVQVAKLPFSWNTLRDLNTGHHPVHDFPRMGHMPSGSTLPLPALPLPMGMASWSVGGASSNAFDAATTSGAGAVGGVGAFPPPWLSLPSSKLVAGAPRPAEAFPLAVAAACAVWAADVARLSSSVFTVSLPDGNGVSHTRAPPSSDVPSAAVTKSTKLPPSSSTASAASRMVNPLLQLFASPPPSHPHAELHSDGIQSHAAVMLGACVQACMHHAIQHAQPSVSLTSTPDSPRLFFAQPTTLSESQQAVLPPSTLPKEVLTVCKAVKVSSFYLRGMSSVHLLPSVYHFLLFLSPVLPGSLALHDHVTNMTDVASLSVDALDSMNDVASDTVVESLAMGLRRLAIARDAYVALTQRDVASGALPVAGASPSASVHGVSTALKSSALSASPSQWADAPRAAHFNRRHRSKTKSSSSPRATTPATASWQPVAPKRSSGASSSRDAPLDTQHDRARRSPSGVRGVYLSPDAILQHIHADRVAAEKLSRAQAAAAAAAAASAAAAVTASTAASTVVSSSLDASSLAAGASSRHASYRRSASRYRSVPSPSMTSSLHASQGEASHPRHLVPTATFDKSRHVSWSKQRSPNARGSAALSATEERGAGKRAFWTPPSTWLLSAVGPDSLRGAT